QPARTALDLQPDGRRRRTTDADVGRTALDRDGHDAVRLAQRDIETRGPATDVHGTQRDLLELRPQTRRATLELERPRDRRVERQPRLAPAEVEQSAAVLD